MVSAISVQKEPSTGVSRFYRPELDLLRFLAFSLVFMSHADEHPAVGALGVPVFFLLSAYLITELLLRERDRTGTVDVRKFYIRRSLRIWPLYFAVLILGKVFGRISNHSFLAYMLLCGNWYTSLRSYLPYGLAALWSIGIEEQFYLVWPTLVRFGGRRGVMGTSAALWLLAQAAVCVMSQRHLTINPAIWTSAFSQMQYFALGAGISVVLHGRLPSIRRWRRAVLLTLGLVAFVLADTVFHTSLVAESTLLRTEPGYLITGLGAALIFLALLGARVPQALDPLVSLGKISYGLYVFHQCCIYACYQLLHVQHYRLVGAPIALACTVVMAWLSYRYFETPFLRLKERFEVVRSRAV